MPTNRPVTVCDLSPPDNPDYTVKPRKPVNVKAPIVVCDATLTCWYERDSAMGNAQWGLIELVKYLRENWPRNTDKATKKRTVPIMFVCHNPHKVVDVLLKEFGDDPQYNFKVSKYESDRYHRDGQIRKPRIQTTRDLGIGFFGFRTSDRHTQYFHPVSPFEYMEDFGTYGDTKLPEYIRLYQWGGNLRKWIRRNKLTLSPRKGGLAAQLLRDKRFYPKARRKVPRLTNEKARPAMPGNYYAVSTDRIGRLFHGVYEIDQQNAHHYAAETVPLPNANKLFAHGRFLSNSDKPYAVPGSYAWDKLTSEYGLYRMRVWVPRHINGTLPPFALNHGLHNVFLYGNEFDLCRKLGVEIRHIAYCWTSPDLDTGLRKYAQWAQREVTQFPSEKPWLKPTLLSVYGVLASRPRHIESAYYRSDKGKSERYFLGGTPVMMKQVKTKREIQSNIANTIHRGMIEAETRKLSIELARRLERERHTVIGVHSDAVFVKDEGQTLPLLPAPWRIKEHHKNFRAKDRVSYESDTILILPGRKRAR